ncbi:FadR/GntR family transcriptional regulator [Acuticoccus mangrovi]|uniref:FadR family transcriptional regulator n=1 Tax=Acuticoccus mangrovi TaxID=2796142 RepID=A0A934IML2_9HYPH|nr:FadR/GntR family transcriptional regulator [Acuticoccus mangrovi]MBJ3774174.1 FadR family transcriptional regulator [Acuticoccus mangrovi]
MTLDAFILETVPELRDGIGRRSLREVVAGKIAWLIASGILKPGDDLPPERALATALRVSRESVRGGVQILATMGVVAVAHGTRTKVLSDRVDADLVGTRPSLINSYSLEDVHAARLAVERPVVADAAERIDEGVLDILEDLLVQHRAAFEDPVRFLIVDREFHLAIYRVCANPVLADFVSDLYAYMMPHRFRAMAEPDAIRRSFEDHEAILAALKARDRAHTVAAFDVHIRHIYETTMAILARSGGPPAVN